MELCNWAHLCLSRRMFPTNSYRWRFGLSHSILPERRIRLSMSFMSEVTWRPCWCSYIIIAIFLFFLINLQDIPVSSHCMESDLYKERIRKDSHLSDFKVCFSIQVRCLNVAHTLWFTVAGERIQTLEAVINCLFSIYYCISNLSFSFFYMIIIVSCIFKFSLYKLNLFSFFF